MEIMEKSQDLEIMSWKNKRNTKVGENILLIVPILNKYSHELLTIYNYITFSWMRIKIEAEAKPCCACHHSNSLGSSVGNALMQTGMSITERLRPAVRKNTTMELWV